MYSKGMQLGVAVHSSYAKIVIGPFSVHQFANFLCIWPKINFFDIILYFPEYFTIADILSKRMDWSLLTVANLHYQH